MLKKRFMLFLLLPVLLLTACGVLSEAGAPAEDAQTSADTQADTQMDTPAAVNSGTGVTFADDLGRQVTVEDPQRVVALTGSFADVWCLAGGKETLAAAADNTWTSFDLGLDESVVNIGTINEPNLERILAAEPDLILGSCNTASNLDLLDTFEASGIPAAYFDIQTFDDYLRMLQICTEITGVPEAFAENGTAIRSQVDAAIARQDGSSPTVLCMRISGSSCKVKGSVDNVLGEMLSSLGCRNIADSDDSLLENLSLEAILAADPDYIFAVLQGSDTTRAEKMLEETLLCNPAWSSLRAVQSGNFHLMEHELYNLKPNARWGEAYEKLADILYPET